MFARGWNIELQFLCQRNSCHAFPITAPEQVFFFKTLTNRWILSYPQNSQVFEMKVGSGGQYVAYEQMPYELLIVTFILWSCFRSSSPVGAYILSAKIVGHFYDEEADLYHPAGDDDENSCLGRQCFGFSLLILAIVCILGASLGAILSIRTRKLYARIKLHSGQ